MWSGEELKLTSKQCEKRHSSQKTDIIKVEMLIRESADSRQLQIGYSMHCPRVHAHGQWVQIGLEHMLAIFISATRGLSCEEGCKMTQCRLEDSAVHQPIKGSSHTRFLFEKGNVQHLQALFQKANIPLQYIILGDTTINRKMREEGIEDGGYFLHIGDAHMLYLHWLTLSSGSAKPFLCPFTTCLSCIIQGIAGHKHSKNWSEQWARNSCCLSDTMATSTFHFYGLSDDKETLAWSFPVYSIQADKHASCELH